MSRTEDRVRDALQGYRAIPVTAPEEVAVLERAGALRGRQRRQRLVGAAAAVAVLAVIGVVAVRSADDEGARTVPADAAVLGSPYYVPSAGARLSRASEGRLGANGMTYAEVWQPSGARVGERAVRVVVAGGGAGIDAPNRDVNGKPAMLVDQGAGVLEVRWVDGGLLVTVTARGLDEPALMTVAGGVRADAAGGPVRMTTLPVDWAVVAQGPMTPDTVAVDQDFLLDGAQVRLLTHPEGAIELHGLALMPGAEPTTMLGRPAVLVTYTDADEVDIVWVDAAGVLVRLQGKDKALLGRFATGLVPVSRSTWLQRVTTAGVVPSLMDDTSPTLVAPPSSMPHVLDIETGLAAPADRLVVTASVDGDDFCDRVSSTSGQVLLEGCGSQPGALPVQMACAGQTTLTVDGREEQVTILVASVPAAPATVEVVADDGTRRALTAAPVPGSAVWLAGTVIRPEDRTLEARRADGMFLGTMNLAPFQEDVTGG